MKKFPWISKLKTLARNNFPEMLSGPKHCDTPQRLLEIWLVFVEIVRGVYSWVAFDFGLWFCLLFFIQTWIFQEEKKINNFLNLSDEKILSLVIQKGFKSSKNLSKSMTLRKPFKTSVIWAVSGVTSSIGLKITIVFVKFVL